MKILLSGGSGFLGKGLTKRLTDIGHHVTVLSSKSADLTKDDSLLPFNNEKYDMIYHMAAWTQAGDFCLYHQGEQWIINQRINTNMLAWWQQYQPQAKLIAFGTSVSYATEDNLSEKVYMDGMPNDKFYSYAMSKRMLYSGLISINKQYGLKYLYLIPSVIYGPGYHTDGRQLHFIYDLIRKILNGSDKGEPVQLWGDGYQRRELVYIDDFVEILIKLAETVDNNIFNIGAGEDYTIRQFAEIICKKVGYDFDKIQFDTTKYVGAKSKCLSVDKLKSEMPGYSVRSLESGLEKTIDWVKQNRSKLG